MVAKPTEHQQEMVQALSGQAALVHSGTVDPSVDNMLKITSDRQEAGTGPANHQPAIAGRPGTKVNQCVANIPADLAGRAGRQADPAGVLRHFHPDRALQKGGKIGRQQPGQPEIHALETAIPAGAGTGLYRLRGHPAEAHRPRVFPGADRVHP